MRAPFAIVVFFAALASTVACSDTVEPEDEADAGTPRPDAETPHDAGMTTSHPDGGLIAIRIAAAGSTSLAPGDTRMLTATGVRADQSEIDLTAAATWSSDAPAIADVRAGGTVVAFAAGAANITASRGGIESAPLAITVEDDPPPPMPTEMRAAWVTRWSYSSIADLETVIGELDRANFNAVFFQVRGTADAYYVSSREPWASRLSGTLGEDPGWDPLAEVVRIAHGRGMVVHAWINTFPAWSGTTPPSDSATRHPLLAHPEWLCADEAGVPMPPQSSGYQFFSPGNAEVRAHIAGVAQEINDRYQVDGIHMDFIRYPGSNYCHDAASEAAYATALASRPDLSYSDFQRDAITALVTDLKSRVRFLSVASWGVYENVWGWSSVSQGNIDYMQDAHRWAREGLLDALCPMIYWATTEPRGGRLDFQTLTDHHKAAADQGGTWLFTGINAELDVSEVIKEIEYARTASAAGFVIFDYSLIRPALDALANGVLSERVPPPSR